VFTTRSCPSWKKEEEKNKQKGQPTSEAQRDGSADCAAEGRLLLLSRSQRRCASRVCSYMCSTTTDPMNSSDEMSTVVGPLKEDKETQTADDEVRQRDTPHTHHQPHALRWRGRDGQDGDIRTAATEKRCGPCVILSD